MPRGDGRALRAEVLKSRVTGGRALIASARNFKSKPLVLSTTGRRSEVKAEKWQELAWEFYDTVPEYHYAANWVGNLLSRAKLYVTESGEPSTDATATELLGGLFGGPEQQPEMLRQLGIHFTVAGEGYVIGYEDPANDGEEIWQVAAATAIKVDQPGTAAEKWTVDGDELPDDALVIRLWRPHPAKPKLADCPTRAALPILSEIDGLTKHVAAQIDSRLASAGILFVPEEMSFGAVTPDQDGEDDDPQPTSKPDELVKELIAVGAEAMTDRQSPAAVIPVIIQAPGEHIGNVKHVTLWSELDGKAKEMREEAIRRLALGLDMPPEALTGTADMNHWNAWQMDEAGIKAHTEPLLAVIAGTLAVGFLQPALIDPADGLETEETPGTGIDAAKARTFGIGVDTTALRVRPNRSKEAFELHNIGALSTTTMLRENGFDPTNDAMSPEDRAFFFLMKLAGASPTPNMVLAAARALGVPGMEDVPNEPTQVREDIKIDGQLPANGGDTDVEPGNPSGDTTPSSDGHPVQGPPETPNDGAPRNNDHKASVSRDSQAILVAGGLLVNRALERAGNRIKSQARAKVPGVPAAELYLTVRPDFTQVSLNALLEDAWSGVPKAADELGIDAAWFTAALDDYTRGLLHTGTAHDRALLAGHIARHARLAA